MRNLEITIAGKKYPLHFGIGFVRELDQVAGMKRDGMSLGFGLTMTIPALLAYDPAALADVIYAATKDGSNPRPIQPRVEDFVEQQDDLGKLFDEVNAEISTSKILAPAIKNLKGPDKKKK